MTKFRSIMSLAIILALGLSSCGGGGSSSDTPPTSSDTPPTTAKVEITSVVYNDNGTVPIDDDTITVYFSEEIDESSLPLDIESVFLVEGAGKIGTTTERNYAKGWPYKLSIQLNNTALPGDKNTKISIADNVIKAANSGYYIEESTPKNWEASHIIFVTGQDKSYNEGGEVVLDDDSLKDDGFYKNGIVPKLTRNPDETVTDEISGLIWQDNNDSGLVTKQWMTDSNFALIDSANEDTLYNTSGDTAATYCTDLVMASYDDWRLPTKQELSSITVKSKIDPSINNDIFENMAVDDYWTITPCGECPELAWKVNFYDGASSSLESRKNIDRYVRCVRDNR